MIMLAQNLLTGLKVNVLIQHMYIMSNEPPDIIKHAAS